MVTEHIVKSEDTCGGKARIRDRRVRVQDIAYYSEWCSWTPDRIATELDLTLAQVHAALSYYFDNIVEIREEMRQAEQLSLELFSQTASKLNDKLAPLLLASQSPMSDLLEDLVDRITPDNRHAEADWGESIRAE